MKTETKINNVAEFLKKAVRALSGKARVLKAKLMFLASLRRRTAMVGQISHDIRALMAGREKAAAAAAEARGKALAAVGSVDEQAPAALQHGHGIAALSELLREVSDDDGRGGGYPDWTHSLFDDDLSDDGGGVIEELDDEPSVIDVIRSRREGEGVEFNIEEEIDHAADMFIRRVRSRMNNRSFA